MIIPSPPSPGQCTFDGHNICTMMFDPGPLHFIKDVYILYANNLKQRQTGLYEIISGSYSQSYGSGQSYFIYFILFFLLYNKHVDIKKDVIRFSEHHELLNNLHEVRSRSKDW